MPSSRRPLVNLRPAAGFVAALAALGLSPEVMVRGSQCFIPTADGRMRAFPGLTIQATVQGGTLMMPVSDGYGSLGSVGSPGSGSLAASIADSLWYAGSGPLRFNGAAIGALSASSTLSFLLRAGATYGTTAFQAGRVAPTAAALTARDNVGGKINGSLSMRFTRINSTTGGESDASDPTLPVTVIDGKVIASFNGISLDANGQDKWGPFSSRLGFQTKGPHYGLAKTPEIADSSLATLFGIPRAVELDFTDAELDYDRIAPIDNDPPPACTHVAALENIIIAFGVFGGTGVISSKPNFLEAFPIDNLSFLPERPIAVYPRPAQGFILVACRNSLYAVVYTGATPPYALQSILPETGVAAYHNICFAENSIYFFTERRGIGRVLNAGEPDYEFAADVAEYTAGWNPANVVVGYDVPTQHVVYCHGSEILPFNKQTKKWGTPIPLSAMRSGGASAPVSGTIKSCVTHQGKLNLAVDTGSIFALYRYGEGGGSRAIYQSPWIPAERVSETLVRIRPAIEGAFNRASTWKIFTNGDSSTAVETFNLGIQTGGSRLRHLEAFKPGDAKNCESFMLQVTIDSDDGSEGILNTLVESVPSNVTL
jgi:hypothetical protein